MMSQTIPLFKNHPKLSVIPWLSVANVPTSVQRMIQTSKLIERDIWVKRDDLTHAMYGGNKLRKYEFVFADALAKGKKKILTQGSIGTNHVLVTAVHAQKFGLETHFIYLNRNYLLEY